MQETVRSLPIWTLPTLVGLIAIGCSSGDERFVELSRESADHQVEQNRLVETNNRQVLEATDKLVEADAKSRTENIELHRQIEAERSGVNLQRDALEQERRQIAQERNRAPIVADSILAVGGLIAAIVPLLVCLFLLRGLFHKSDQEALAEVLVEDLVSRQPLLSGPAAVSLPGTGREPRLAATRAEEPQEQF
jgi:VIT1/CCC1 family predicted Fe2+/Mn2+ transporter